MAQGDKSFCHEKNLCSRQRNSGSQGKVSSKSELSSGLHTCATTHASLDITGHAVIVAKLTKMFKDME